jgi:hypothetical protein
MNPIFAAAVELQDFCHAQGWRFCFIGGLAVQRWGELEVRPAPQTERRLRALLERS